MNKDNTTQNTRREVLAGVGLATLGLIGLNSAWQKLNNISADPEPNRFIPRNDASFPNVTLYTHDGETVRFYDDVIRNKVVAINMMYTQCGGICPRSTANLVEVQKILGDRIGRDVFMYSITLQPELDSPRRLKQYAERHGIKSGWKFLTGTPEDIEIVRYKLGFYDRDENLDNIRENHTGMVRIGNDALNRWSMAPTLSDPEQIMATINHLDPKTIHTSAVHLFDQQHS